jgi:NAD dependent epimerase/dehydratase family enzyme
MKTVLITGASGLIGTHLTLLLQQKGYRIIHLNRSLPKKSNVETYLWDVPKQTIDERAVKEADYIVHLAGAGIADKKWTAERKKRSSTAVQKAFTFFLKPFSKQILP